MENYIPLISAVLVAIGWFVNGIYNRKNAIALKRLEYRIESFKSYFKVQTLIAEHKGNPPIDELNMCLLSFAQDMKLFGDHKEQNILEDIDDYMSKKDMKGLDRCLEKLYRDITPKIRKELGVK